MKRTILGIFMDRKDADTALFRLREKGIRAQEISVIARQDLVGRYHRPKNEAEGILTGGVLGGVAGLILGLTPIILPGIGAIVVAGPLTMLTSTLMGVLAGGLIGTLVEIGVPERSAKFYQKSIKRGGILLAITINNRIEKKVREILEEEDAEELTVIPYTQKVSGQILEEQLNVAYQHKVSPKRKKGKK